MYGFLPGGGICIRFRLCSPISNLEHRKPLLEHRLFFKCAARLVCSLSANVLLDPRNLHGVLESGFPSANSAGPVYCAFWKEKDSPHAPSGARSSPPRSRISPSACSSHYAHPPASALSFTPTTSSSPHPHTGVKQKKHQRERGPITHYSR